MRLENRLEIDAPAEAVWDLTLDVERWPGFTDTITSIERLEEGPMTLGSTARISQPGMWPMVWTVTRFEPPTVFVWEARLGPIRMIADHRIEPIGTDRSTNMVAIEMRGPGSGILGRLAGRRLAQAIATENRGFKATAEG